MTKLSSLCYIEKDNQYLMLHRVKKVNDENHDKWIGVGGKFEHGESPEDCMLREVWEETGYTLTSWKYRGIITFVLGEDTVEYMSLFTADGFEGTAIDCNEGVLEWVAKDRISELNLWEGDRIFFRLLEEREEFFSLKLVYNKQDVLEQAVLDGKELELFDILNEDGSKTGVVKERGVAHREGALHGTVHIWIVRENDKSGYDVLLQKRSDNKDSHPGCYDISSAGHISAGDEVMESALRELEEELGLSVQPEQLELFGTTHVKFEAAFYGKIFRDNEISSDFVYRQPVDIDKLNLQESEVSEVRWMDYEECRQNVAQGSMPNCINPEEFERLGDYLGIR